MIKVKEHSQMITNTLEILYEDNHILVCIKPHGIATQSRRIDQPDMEHMLLNHLAASGHKSSGEAARPYLAVIHRLDQPVSGILVFAKTPQAAKNLNRQLTTDGFGKHYLAFVDGIPKKPQGTLINYMVKDGRSNTSRICKKDTPGARQARLSYRVLPNPQALCARLFPSNTFVASKSADSTDSRALLDICLDTGRHHQIRVQLAHIGCPIVGDTKYNPKAGAAQGWQTLALCAYKLSFRHPVTSKDLTFYLPGYPS